MSGGGRKGGDSVKWVGKALRVVGAEGVWAHIGMRMRALLLLRAVGAVAV